MIRNKFSQEDIDNILLMYYGGVTQQKIADEYCTQQGTIAGIIKRNTLNWKPHRGKSIDTSEYDNIIKLYNDKKTQPEIAKLYNCSVSVISSILRRNNVKTRPGGSMNTNEDIEEWIKMYKDGMMIKDIAQECNIARTTVSDALKHNGVEIDKYTYHCDEHFFDIIDTPEKAYILGLLWADGCNCVNKNYVTLSLQDNDKEILDIINHMTQNDRPLHKNELSKKNPKYHDQYIITWGSKYLSQLLNQLGMCQNKTLVAEYPNCIPDVFHKHFIRGYFDGDGCISLSQNGKFADVSIVGTSMLLNSMKDIIKKQINIDVVVKRDGRARDPICTLRCNKKNDVFELLQWVYDNATIYFKRKYNKYNQFLSNNINNSYLN